MSNKEIGLTGFRGSFQNTSPETKGKGVSQGCLGFIFERIPILFHGWFRHAQGKAIPE